MTAFMCAMQKDYHGIVQKLLNSGATYGVNQTRLFYNLRLFVDIHGGRSKNFNYILKEEKGKGYCAGLTKIWLYSKWASENNLRKYTNEWFLDTMRVIAEWDGKSPLNKNITQDFNEFLSLVTFFQNSRYTGLTIPQTDFKTLLEHSPLPLLVDNNELDLEYTIASTITLEKLRNLLNKIVYNNKLVVIYSTEPLAHSVALYKVDDNYYYYNPDMFEGEVIIASVEEIAQKIFNSFNCSKRKFPAVGFSIYDFKNYNPTCLITNEILFTPYDPFSLNVQNVIYLSVTTYPDQEKVLTELEPFANEAALFPAATIGCWESIKYFLQKNVSINAVLGKNIATPLIIALENEHFDLVKEMVEENADLNFQTIDGNTALIVALSKSSEITEMLLDRGADPDLKTDNGITTLMLAAQNGDVDVIKKILVKSANPKHLINMAAKTNGVTALVLALISGYPKVAIELLKNDANPNLQLPNGKTSLMIASQNGYIDVVEEILAKSPNVKLLIDAVMKHNGITALMLAVDNEHYEIVSTLLSRCANTALVANINGKSMTALDIARLDNSPMRVKIQKLLNSTVPCVP
jgi:ankyrin repeat protein